MILKHYIYEYFHVNLVSKGQIGSSNFLYNYKLYLVLTFHNALRDILKV